MESLIIPKKHYISETNGPFNDFPEDKYLDVNDICEICDEFLDIEKKNFKMTKKGGPKGFVQINNSAYNRVEFLFAIINIEDKTKGTDINPTAKNKFETLKEENDQAGHLLAKNLGGKGGMDNVIPQNAKINQGNWKEMEKVISNDVENYGSVEFTLRVIYDDTHKEFMKRPKEILFKVESKQKKLIRFGKVDNPPSNFVKLKQYLIKNLKQVNNIKIVHFNEK